MNRAELYGDDPEAIIRAIDGPFDWACPYRLWIDNGLAWLNLYANNMVSDSDRI